MDRMKTLRFHGVPFSLVLMGKFHEDFASSATVVVVDDPSTTVNAPRELRLSLLCYFIFIIPSPPPPPLLPPNGFIPQKVNDRSKLPLNGCCFKSCIRIVKEVWIRCRHKMKSSQ